MVTAADVAQWGKFDTPTGAELAVLERVIAAVTEHITDNYRVNDPLTDSQEVCVLLQASRLWGRRDTREGIAAFGDIAAVRITALDADVAMMLTRNFGFA